MNKVAVPDERSEGVTAAVLAGWGATIRLAILRLIDSAGPTLAIVVTWLTRR